MRFTFILRKFLCLGHPLMCLGEKMFKKLKKDTIQLEKDSFSHGAFFIYPIPISRFYCNVPSSCFRRSLKYQHHPATHAVLCFSIRSEFTGRCTKISCNHTKAGLQLVKVCNSRGIFCWFCNPNPPDYQFGVHDISTHLQTLQSLRFSCFCRV